MSGTMPATRAEMRRAMYEQKGTAACKGCGATIEWWRTTNGKMLPVDVQPAGDDALIVTHWVTCPNSTEFKTGAKPSAAPADPNQQRTVEVERFCQKHGALAVVAVYDGFVAVSWHPKAEPEDLRQDLITAGNYLRESIRKGEPK